MTPTEKVVRPARIEDADVLAELVDYAGEGLPSYLWHKIAGPFCSMLLTAREHRG